MQNRGALHIHLLLWIKVNKAIKNNYINNDYIWARMHPNKEVNDKVKKYQIHTCQAPGCLKYGKKLYNKCKYGFPFELCEEDYLDDNNNLYKYIRLTDDDRKIVPYNPTLLLLWDGHLNIQYVTKKGIEQYLVKYISKVEPSQFVNYKQEHMM